MKLKDIRCETCPRFDLSGAKGKRLGWCSSWCIVTFVGDGCRNHPLWQKALDEEAEREAEERKARRKTAKQLVRNAYKLGVTKAGSPRKRGGHD